MITLSSYPYHICKIPWIFPGRLITVDQCTTVVSWFAEWANMGNSSPKRRHKENEPIFSSQPRIEPSRITLSYGYPWCHMHTVKCISMSMTPRGLVSSSSPNIATERRCRKWAKSRIFSFVQHTWTSGREWRDGRLTSEAMLPFFQTTFGAHYFLKTITCYLKGYMKGRQNVGR